MKKLLIIAGIAAAGLSITGCGGGKGPNPGHAYMPDMYYSRAYEAYGYNNIDDYEKLKTFLYKWSSQTPANTTAHGSLSAKSLF